MGAMIEGAAPEHCDVAVVGAGPAGATAALVLARAGARVALIEKARMPRYKTCGGGVVGRAFGLLPDGVELAIQRDYRAVVMSFLDVGLDFRVERARTIVGMSMRAELDQSIADAAVAGGAQLISPCAFEGLRQEPDGIVLETTTGTMRARLVIAADGALSPVARAAGWTQAIPAIPALEAEVTVPPQTLARFDVPRFDFGVIDAGYGWVFPKQEHLSVGVLSMRRGRVALGEVLDGYLARVGIDTVHACERHGFVIPVEPRRGGFARGRVLLVGDAAGLADPLTGEGISYAIESGRAAAEAWLASGSDPTRVGARYQAKLRSGPLAELRVARLLARLLYRRTGLVRSLFRRRGQSLCEAMTDVILGVRSYRSLALNPLNYLRMLRPRRTAAHIR